MLKAKQRTGSGCYCRLYSACSDFDWVDVSHMCNRTPTTVTQPIRFSKKNLAEYTTFIPSTTLAWEKHEFFLLPYFFSVEFALVIAIFTVWCLFHYGDVTLTNYLFLPTMIWVNTISCQCSSSFLFWVWYRTVVMWLKKCRWLAQVVFYLPILWDKPK